MEIGKTFKELAGITSLAEAKVSPEEQEKIQNREQYENIYVDIVEDINQMKTYAKDKGLSNEQINPLVEALVMVDKIDDLIRANFTEEDEVQDPEEEGKW